MSDTKLIRNLTRNNDNISYPFELPVVGPKDYKEDKDCLRRWYIDYKVWSLQDKILIPVRKFVEGNTYEKRIQYIQQAVRTIEKALVSGATHKPRTKKKKDSKGSTIEQGTFVVRDIEEAFAKVMQLYEAAKVAGTIRALQSDKRMFLEWIARSRPYHELQDITRADIINYLDDYQILNKWSNNTKIGKRERLGMFFSKMVDRGWIEKSPCIGIRIKAAPKRKNTTYTPDQKREVLNTVRSEDQQLWFYIHFIYYAFLRPKEVMGLKVGDVKLDGSVILVSGTNTKNSNSKSPTISKPFAEVLKQMNLHLYPGDFYVFGRDGKPGKLPVAKNYFSAMYRRILEGLGYSLDYSLYSWKHTGNVDAVLSGMDIKSIQLQNGHSDLSVTDEYLRDLGVRIDSNFKHMQRPILDDKKKPSQDT